MLKVKQFIKDRNIFLLISCIISALLFAVCLGVFMQYAQEVGFITNSINDVNNNSSQIIENTNFAYTIFSITLNEATTFFCILLSLVTIFTIVGYVYKENSFILASILLNVITFFMAINKFNLTAKIILLLLFVFNILSLITKKEKN